MNPSPKTTVSVNDHDAFKRSLYKPTEIESLWGEPSQSRSEKEVAKLLQILDEIQVEELRENSFEREASK